MKTLQEWLKTAGNIHAKKIDLGLDRVQAVAKKMDLLNWHCPVITVGGTNGKGSTVTLLETLYHTAGYKTGALTSPDLLRYNERIRINRVEATDNAICQAFTAVEEARGKITLSFFEFNLLVALVLFKAADLDVIMLEVGLGGRLDACNIINPDLAVITSIALDHMEFLGNTREAIATEKAGIFRQGKPAIIGELSPPKTLINAAETLSVKASYINKDFNHSASDQHWSWASKSTRYLHLPKPKILYQNAATALAAAEALQEQLPIKKAAIQKALETTALPGRFEVIHHQKKYFIFDVAHNPAACEVLAKNLKKHFDKVEFTAVFSMLSSKEILPCIQHMKPFIGDWHVAELKHERATSLDALKAATHNLHRLHVHKTIENAAEEASKTANHLLIFGSFVTVANIKRHFGFDEQYQGNNDSEHT